MKAMLQSGIKAALFAGALAAGVAAGPAAAESARPAPTATGEAEHFVRPDVRAYLDRLNANPRPAITPEFLAIVRQMPPEAMSAQAMGDRPVGELGEIRDVVIPGPAGELRARLFDPRPAAQRAPGPVVVFYHGGAFILGGIETHAGLAAEIARQLDLPVISMQYRLAPEHAWPAAPDDAEAGARWIAGNGAAFGREFTGLVLAGDSAGGNLTLVTALALRDRPTSVPVILQMPIYPATDRSGNYASAGLFASGYGLDLDGLQVEKFYKPDTEHWRYAPMHADLAGVAPTAMVTASLDPLRDEGRAYAAKLIEAGVPTAYHEARGTIHGFATYRAAIPSAQDDLTAYLALVKAMLGDQS